MTRAEEFADTPVFRVEDIPPGVGAHIGGGEFVTRCDKGCGQVYSCNYVSQVQRHLWEVHEISVAMLP